MSRLTIICVLCCCALFSQGSATGENNAQNTHGANPPLEFPKESDSDTPIVTGNNPKSSSLPPKMFPSENLDHNAAGPPILSGSEKNIKDIMEKSANHEAKHENTTSEVKSSNVAENTTTTENPMKIKEKLKGEQDDMLHSSYKGGQDVDELLKPEKKATEKDEKKVIEKDEKKIMEKDEKKATEKDEKKPIYTKKDPNSEVDVSQHFDIKGPKLMNETKAKSGESVLESTSKIMAVSSSVLSNTNPKQHHGIIEPAKTIVSVLLTIAVILCLGVIGLLVWRKIAMRRFGRDVLINEDDFDEVSDMHTFDSAQIQIT